MKLLDRLFGLEEINGGERCPTYLYRWTLLKWGDYGVYLHHFVGDDWSLDLHDHPKRFISIGLKGAYEEETPCQSEHCETPMVHTRRSVWRAPWVRSFAAIHRHRLSMIGGGDCLTLVIVLKAVREWGFWTRLGFIPWRKYVAGSLADERKACR